VLAGAFRWEGDHFYNSVHWIYDGKLQNCFDKRHAMALTERLPSLFQFSFLKQSFFAKQPQVTPATKHKEIMHIDTEWSLVPYICSELFFNNYPDDNFGKAPIVAVCNDRLLAPYVAHLMFLAARCKATQWQRVIVYVSFLYQQVLMPSGHSAPLKRIS